MASIPLKMDVGIVGLSHPERAASGSGIWGRRIAFRSRAEEWSQKIEKNAKSCRCEVGRKSDVASPLASEIGGEIVITEDPFVIQEPLLGKHPNPKNVAAIILGGGPGTHLFPLTRTRATPAGIKELGISTPQLIDFAIERALSTSPSILLSLLPCCYQYRMNQYRHHDEELYWKGGPGIISSSLDFSLSFPILLPKVPVGGCYKLIDITMSNCINCGINKILVMTQYNSASLNRHISLTYNFGNGVNLGDGFIEVLAATQSPGETGMNWFQGTADAVRQFTWLFESNRRENIEYIVILSGDQLYRMDYMDFVQKHIESGADISLSCTPVDDSRASDYGIVKIDKRGRINQFFEKPKDADLESMKDDDTLLRLPHQDPKKYPYMASMGVYVFNRNILLELLRWTYPKANDFGLDVLPFAVKSYNVQAYIFTDYWEDIGTIKSFFDANMALTDQPPKFQFYDPSTPIITLPRFLPPTKMEQCKIVDSIISDGCFFHNSSIQHSIVGVRSRIDYGAELKDTLMMGADTYETEREIALLLEEGKVPIGVGQNTQIRNCIIDMNARIGKNVIIANKNGVKEADRSSEGFYIRSGITIISKNATIKDGTVI